MWLVINLLGSADRESEFNRNFITYLLCYLKQVAVPQFLSLICKMGVVILTASEGCFEV